jgi:hypothetical protein
VVRPNLTGWPKRPFVAERRPKQVTLDAGLARSCKRVGEAPLLHLADRGGVSDNGFSFTYLTVSDGSFPGRES